jgi:hypothetical protein
MGNKRLGVVEECQIGILPVCFAAPVAMTHPKTTPMTCDQTENKQVLSYNRTLETGQRVN